MKSISPVIAIVVLMIMTVAAAGMAYLTITTYQTQTAASGEGGLETLGTRARTQLKIESVAGGKIYLRNLGTDTFTGAQFFVEGRPLNVSGPVECNAGSVCVYEVEEDVNCTGDCELSMGLDLPIGTQVTVEEEEIEPETICGDASCDPDEDCTTCPADCGVCVYCLSLEVSYESRTSANTESDSVYSLDVDADGTAEILTGERAWEFPPGRYRGVLKVWNKTNGSFNVKNSTDWYNTGSTYVRSVYALDVDADSTVEILTAGDADDGTRPNAQLKVWNRTGGVLNLENSTEWYTTGNTYIRSVYALDIDGDSTLEILTAGDAHDGTRQNAQLRIWNRTGGTLNLENSTEWYNTGHTYAYSVSALDVDADGTIEIITAGSTLSGSYQVGQLRIWNRTGGTLNLEDSIEWQLAGSGETRAYSMYPLDVDGDGTVEILTAGHGHYNGRQNGQLMIWNMTAGTIILENSTWWYRVGMTHAYSIYSLDVDNDGTKEIITAGTSQSGPAYEPNAQLRVWNYTIC
jgi:flagellin-like protein